jgi:phage terminase large subunit-like protein
LSDTERENAQGRASDDLVPGTDSGEHGIHHARIALVAETAADARDVMVEGESGISRCIRKNFDRFMSHPSVEVAGGSLAIGMGYASPRESQGMLKFKQSAIRARPEPSPAHTVTKKP